MYLIWIIGGGQKDLTNKILDEIKKLYEQLDEIKDKNINSSNVQLNEFMRQNVNMLKELNQKIDKYLENNNEILKEMEKYVKEDIEHKNRMERKLKQISMLLLIVIIAIGLTISYMVILNNEYLSTQLFNYIQIAIQYLKSLLSNY
ncbi:hypothetical protein MJ_1417.1 [Methanocaldococcus jannaschii DSM 2661]|uniref:Uncharacterized protein MJ1417.1 n=1 Tax=Methanocaldococcus jannaschii (strain ATCC 43067 / DSM 2661 / JAL-1 / JCM 10045 / NBRC 100440) TaxID=243232 RepID=YE1A_METJA|nr:RecName: Full=Uncharacterized protein MJ1417.1 [Methanocaldococcus jannaschii DSM 2661]AAB99431.1 hypothetical protein MJ_1417.1 [Methanocaldococcus jannaschii DSM 2661]